MKQILGVVVAGAMASSIFPTHAQQPVPPNNIPSVLQSAQVDESYRINELQEQVRHLNGQVEELNFLLLQLQEKLRLLEEENELRFQELEDKQSDAGRSATAVAGLDGEGAERLGKPDTSGAKSAPDENPAPQLPTEQLTKREAEPQVLGTLTFDENGNVVDSQGDSPRKLVGLPGVFSDGMEGGAEAAEFGATPVAVLNFGIAKLKARLYKQAQLAFSAHLKAWPEDPDAGVVKYYLGKSYFWQKEYYRAADSHLDAHNNYPESATAPENLLALGLALAGLNQREVACATYAEVLKQYPESEPRLGSSVRNEQTATRC